MRPEGLSKVSTALRRPAGGQSLGARGLSLQELSRVKALALSERSQAEEELIKAKNQVRLEEVSPQPWPRPGPSPGSAQGDGGCGEVRGREPQGAGVGGSEQDTRPRGPTSSIP